MSDPDRGWDAESPAWPEFDPPRAPADPGAAGFPPAEMWPSAMHGSGMRPTDDMGVPVETYRETDGFPAQEIATEFYTGARRSKSRLVFFSVIGAVALAAVAVAVPLLVADGGSGRHAPKPAKSPPKPANAAAPRPSHFSLITGPGCAGNAYHRVGYYTDGKSGWLAGTGGYAKAGCNGKFDALPLSGSTKTADPTLYAQWVFAPGSHRRCKVAVYIPNKKDDVYVSNNPAHYSIHQQKGNALITEFTVDQAQNLGQWVNAPSFTATGPFYVRLANTGKDWTDTRKTYAHIAAAQATATCD